MYNHRGRKQAEKENRGKDPVSGLYPYDHYDCSTYALTFHRTGRKCFSHYISTKALRALILDAIHMAGAYAISNETEFIQKVRNASEVKQKSDAKALNRKINKAKKRCVELDGLIKKLYEAFASGQLTDKRFALLSGGYEQEQAELESAISEDEEKLRAYDTDTDRAEQFLALAKKYTDFSELTTPVILEFIDRIIVHAPEKDEYGERSQEVEIYLKFIGKFEVPQPEPTAEEIAEQEKARQRRAYYRERGRRQRERKRKEQEGKTA